MEQVERTERYLNRIRKIYEGTSILWEERRYYEDDVISFFMHCYHMRQNAAVMWCGATTFRLAGM